MSNEETSGENTEPTVEPSAVEPPAPEAYPAATVPIAFEPTAAAPPPEWTTNAQQAGWTPPKEHRGMPLPSKKALVITGSAFVGVALLFIAGAIGYSLNDSNEHTHPNSDFEQLIQQFGKRLQNGVPAPQDGGQRYGGQFRIPGGAAGRSAEPVAGATRAAAAADDSGAAQHGK